MSIQRYDLGLDYLKPWGETLVAVLQEKLDGDLVMYADHAAKVARLTGERDELQHAFDMIMSSIERGTKQWQQSTGKTETLPDLGNLFQWLLAERDAAVARAELAEEALRVCRAEIAGLQRLSHGKKQFPDTKGMEMADAILAAAQDAKPRALEPGQGCPDVNDTLEGHE